MRWLKVAVPLAALGVFVGQVANASVPAFVRQTGLTCNQCHTAITPNPDHTFTGIKFRVNGYRTPWIAEKIEAGEEGAMSGQRLVLGLESRLSFHIRSAVGTQTKAPSDPRLPEAEAGAVVTQPVSSLAWYYVGAITENLGMWNEFYSTESSLPGNRTGMMNISEFDLKLTFNPGGGGNIVGMFISNQSNQTPFGSQLTGVSNNQKTGGHFSAPSVQLGVHGWFNDRVAVSLALEPGEDNLDYKRLNYAGTVFIWPMNTDGQWLGFMFGFKVGNDMIPSVTNMQLARPFGSAPVAADRILGVRATRVGGLPYASVNTGDATRLLFDLRYGFLDRGPHSFTSAFGASVEDETYDDGAKKSHQAVGFQARYLYDRTYGVRVQASKYLKNEFTDVSGIVHDIPDDISANVTLIWRQAMNMAWELGFSNSQAEVLDQNWRNGWNWTLLWHFLW